MAICGPAGYGKSVLAAEWARRDPRPFVWLSVDGHDNDPRVLLTYLAVGLDRVEPIDPTVLAALASRGLDRPDGPAPAGGRGGRQGPCGGVVVDEVHLLQDREGREAVAVLVDHLAPGSQLVVLGRELPPRPVAGWRAGGRLAELGPGELA